jgi:hypothetical protein
MLVVEVAAMIIDRETQHPQEVEQVVVEMAVPSPLLLLLHLILVEEVVVEVLARATLLMAAPAS